MLLSVPDGKLYGELGPGDLFIYPVADPDFTGGLGYYLWRKREDGYAEIYTVSEEIDGSMVWKPHTHHVPQGLPGETKVVQIARGRPRE